MISSMPAAMSSELYPWIRIGTPQATSTFSIARRSSPRDSASVLPHSIVIVREISSKFRSSRSFSLNRYWTRSVTGVLRQAGKARWAASTAAPTSRGVDSGVVAISSPVAGFRTETVSVASERTH